MNQKDVFLSRVDIKGSLEELLVRVANEYTLGVVRSYTIIPNGYQELNVLLVTNAGRFVIKIFSKEKTRERIQNNVWGYLTFRKNGVPMPTLQKNSSEEYIFSTEGKRRTTSLIVMDYYEGTHLSPIHVRNDDICSLARYMATIHTNTKRIHRYSDTMGIVNLLSQYKKLNSYLSPELLLLVEPVVREFSSLRLNEFRHSIIHGTFEPENILKKSDGKLWLLDLGCMDYNASIIDMATCLANYTIDLSPNQKRKRVEIFLESYQTIHQVSKQERAALPTLIRAQYALYIIRTNYYRVKLKDSTEQSSSLFSMGKRGIQQWVGLDAL